MEKPPIWQLPEGVDPGLWDYIHSDEIASSYDARLADSPLFRNDVRFVQMHCAQPGRLIDMGCGTGRLLTPCSRGGHWVLGVDLSEEMLRQAGQRKERDGATFELLKANLTRLDCLADRSFDYALCMFSTLGMISGPEARLKVLEHAHRLLRPGGKLILHVHNRWFSLWDRAGRRWLLGDWWRQFIGHARAGDRPMPTHQAIAGLSLHHFTRAESVRLLTRSGFDLLEVQPVGWKGDGVLLHAGWFAGLRAHGYLIAGEKPPSV